MRSLRKVLKHLPLGRHSQGVGAVSAEKKGSAAPSCEFWLTEYPLESTLSGALRIHSTKRTYPFLVN